MRFKLDTVPTERGYLAINNASRKMTKGLAKLGDINCCRNTAAQPNVSQVSHARNIVADANFASVKISLNQVKNIYASRMQMSHPQHVSQFSHQENITGNNVSVTMFPSSARS